MIIINNNNEKKKFLGKNNYANGLAHLFGMELLESEKIQTMLIKPQKNVYST